MRTSVLLGDSTIIKDTIEYIENRGRFKLEVKMITVTLTGEASESQETKKKKT